MKKNTRFIILYLICFLILSSSMVFAINQSLESKDEENRYLEKIYSLGISSGEETSLKDDWNYKVQSNEEINKISSQEIEKRVSDSLKENMESNFVTIEEQEPNFPMDLAQRIPIYIDGRDTLLIGDLYDAYDLDFYRIEIPTYGKLELLGIWVGEYQDLGWEDDLSLSLWSPQEEIIEVSNYNSSGYQILEREMEPGTYYLAVTQLSDYNYLYNGEPYGVGIYFTPSMTSIPVDEISLNSSQMTIQVGNSENLVATVLPSNASEPQVTWSSSNESVASVSSNGLVTGHSQGVAIISASSKDGKVEATCTVTVEESNILVNGVILDKTSATIFEGESLQLSKKIQPTNATNQEVRWLSDMTEVVSVTEEGLVTAHSTGTAYVTVITSDGGYSDTCKIIVKSIEEKIVEFNRINGVAINKEWTIKFNREVKPDEISFISIKRNNIDIPINSNINGEELNIISVKDYDYNTEYLIYIELSNGNQYKMIFETVQEETIVDQEAPEITIIGEQTVNLEYGGEYIDAGVEAIDNVDGTVEANSLITDSQGIVLNSIDTTMPGTYTITYTAIDTAGNKAEATRIVLVSNDTNDFEYDIQNDGISISRYTGTNEDIVVPITINNIPVTEIGQLAFSSSSSQITIDKITLPNSIKRIDNLAFYLTSLGDIVIPDSVTFIGYQAFKSTELYTIKIPELVTYIGNNAFSDNNLNAVEIPDSVTYIGNKAFSPLGESDITLGNGFRNYLIIDSGVLKGHIGSPDNPLIIPNDIREISRYAFSGNNLNYVEIPDSVTYIGKKAFYPLGESDITLGNGLNNYFEINSGVLEGHIGKPNNYTVIPDGVREISSWAFSFSNLESVEIPESVIYIGDYAFDSEVIIIGKINSEAQRFAKENGNVFIEK